MPRSSRDGPLTISTGCTLDVVVLSAIALNSGRTSASIAAITCGNAAGAQPAMVALIATSSTVALPCRGGSLPST